MIYIGDIHKKNDHQYKVVRSQSKHTKNGQILTFGKKVLSMITIGSVIITESSNGINFGQFGFADRIVRESIQSELSDSISQWSAKYRARVNLDRISAAGRKEHPKHISEIINELTKSCRNLSKREKTAVLFSITSKMLN